MTLWVKKNWRPEFRFQNQASHRSVCLVIVELLWRLGCRINRLQQLPVWCMHWWQIMRHPVSNQVERGNRQLRLSRDFISTLWNMNFLSLPLSFSLSSHPPPTHTKSQRKHKPLNWFFLYKFSTSISNKSLWPLRTVWVCESFLVLLGWELAVILRCVDQTDSWIWICHSKIVIFNFSTFSFSSKGKLYLKFQILKFQRISLVGVLVISFLLHYHPSVLSVFNYLRTKADYDVITLVQMLMSFLQWQLDILSCGYVSLSNKVTICVSTEFCPWLWDVLTPRLRELKEPFSQLSQHWINLCRPIVWKLFY